jgi:hypothetical protein
MDFKELEPLKVSALTTINFDFVTGLLNTAREYVIEVEKGIGAVPEKSVPYIFRDRD